MARWHTLWLRPVLSDDIEHELNVERLLTVAHHQPVSAAAHAVCALLLAYATWPHVPHWLAGPLAGAIVLCAFLLIHSWWVHRGHRPKQVSDQVLTKVVLGAKVFGALWGAFSTTLLALAHGEGGILSGFVMIGMAAGGAMMLYAIPAAFIAFLALGAIPNLALLLFWQGKVPTLLVIFAVVYFALLIVSVRFSHVKFIEGVLLRLQNQDLAFRAEAASRAKSRFLANVSHELRTPLNAIIGYAEVIHNQFRGPIANPQYIEFARVIHESGRHLVGIINDILDLSKVEAGKIELEEAPASVPVLVDQAIAIMRQPLESAGLNSERVLEENLPEVIVGSRKIGQVLLNQLSNAVKFTPAGGRVRIEGRHTTDGGVVIRVADTGVGIAAEELEDVIKPFVQGREAERWRVQGTGLGLPLADQLMRLHGGNLSIASARGAGTTVTITLPASRVVPPSALRAAG